jgi:hypothetical protein
MKVIGKDKRAARMAACADVVVSRVCPKCNIRYIIGHKFRIAIIMGFQRAYGPLAPGGSF